MSTKEKNLELLKQETYNILSGFPSKDTRKVFNEVKQLEDLLSKNVSDILSDVSDRSLFLGELERNTKMSAEFLYNKKDRELKKMTLENVLEEICEKNTKIIAQENSVEEVA